MFSLFIQCAVVYISTCNYSCFLTFKYKATMSKFVYVPRTL